MVKANNWINYKLVMNDAKRGIIIFQFHVSVRDHNLVKPDICWICCQLWGWRWRNLCITTKPLWGEERRFLHVVIPVLTCDAISPCWWRVSDVTEMLGCHHQISLSWLREAADIIRCAQGAPASKQEVPTKVREVFTVPGEGPAATRVLSFLKALTSTFTIKNLLWHYSERAIKHSE